MGGCARRGTRAPKWGRQLTDIAKTGKETLEAVREGNKASESAAEMSQAVLNLLSGVDVGMRPGQTDKERLKEVRTIKGSLNIEIMDIKEREQVRMRDVLGETPESRAAREANAGVKAAKAKDVAAAKETKKADADAKRANNAKEKADAKAVKEKAKTTPKAKAAATGSVARSSPAPATVVDMINYCNELVEENVEASVTAAAKETLGLLADYGDDLEQCKVVVDSLIKLAAAARKVPAVDAPPVGVGQWPIGEACGDKTAGGRKCGKKDGCAHRKAFAEATEAEQKRAKTQEDDNVQDQFWDKYRGANPDLVRYWAG